MFSPRVIITSSSEGNPSPRSRAKPKLSDYWESNCVVRGSVTDISAKWYKTIANAMKAGQTRAVLMKLPLGSGNTGYGSCWRTYRSSKGGEYVKTEITLHEQLDSFCNRQGLRWKLELVVDETSSSFSTLSEQRIYCEFVYLVVHWEVPLGYTASDPFDSSE